MLSWHDARQRVIAIVRGQMRPPRSERIPLARALGRVLARTVSADRDQPAFPRSIRDGYAIRSADTSSLPAEFEIVAEIKAGSAFDGEIGAFQAARIMTGAPVPAGADAVVMLEHVREMSSTRIAVDRPIAPGLHFVAQGAEARVGAKLLDSGRRIGFGEIALLAEVGCSPVSVFRRPRVAVLATGDEIVPLESRPGPFEIRDTNSVSLAAQVALSGASVLSLDRARDSAGSLRAGIKAALRADAIVLSGGVSKGKYDLVEDVLKEFGIEFHFDSVAIRPGRPVVFGWCAGKPVFGLPGNPVSTMVTFELFVTPALDLLSGAEPRPVPLVSATLAVPLDEKPGVAHFLPARLEWTLSGPQARPVPWRGSGDVAGMAQANAFLVVPADRASWKAGETIQALIRRDLL
jgi:molybdopterin molybdotransferase